MTLQTIGSRQKEKQSTHYEGSEELTRNVGALEKTTMKHWKRSRQHPDEQDRRVHVRYFSV